MQGCMELAEEKSGGIQLMWGDASLKTRFKRLWE